MKQQTLAMAADQGAGFERFRRRTKREDFLDAMAALRAFRFRLALHLAVHGRGWRGAHSGSDAAVAHPMSTPAPDLAELAAMAAFAPHLAQAFASLAPGGAPPRYGTHKPILRRKH